MCESGVFMSFIIKYNFYRLTSHMLAPCFLQQIHISKSFKLNVYFVECWIQSYSSVEAPNVLYVMMTNCSFPMLIWQWSFLLDCLLFHCTNADVIFDIRVEFAIPHH